MFSIIIMNQTEWNFVYVWNKIHICHWWMRGDPGQQPKIAYREYVIYPLLIQILLKLHVGATMKNKNMEGMWSLELDRR